MPYDQRACPPPSTVRFRPITYMPEMLAWRCAARGYSIRFQVGKGRASPETWESMDTQCGELQSFDAWWPEPRGTRRPLSEREHRLGDVADRRIGDRSGGLLEDEQPCPGDLARDRLAVADGENRLRRPWTTSVGTSISGRRSRQRGLQSSLKTPCPSGWP